jgi:hypothetical protein
MPRMAQVLGERAIGILTAGMPNREVAREFNVHFLTISRLQCCFRASSPVGLFEGGGVLKSISVCNNALLWGKTHSDWLRWLPSGWAYALAGPAPLPSHVKSID